MAEWEKVENAYGLNISNDGRPLNESSNSERKIYEGVVMDQKVAIIKERQTNDYKDFISRSEAMTMSSNTKIEWKDYKPTEFELLKKLIHRNIIHQLDFKYDKNFIYITTELCDKNLAKYCKQPHDIVSVPKRSNILEQVGKGIEYLHNLKNPIVHGDLNPRNILIIENDVNNVTAKITDFRTSVAMDCSQKYNSYMPIRSSDKYYLYSKPPEALNVAEEGAPVFSDAEQPGGAVELTPAWDIYAYGCLIQTVLTKDPNKMHPYGNMTNGCFKNDVIDGIRKLYLEESDSETDLFVLANLAIHDATQKDSWKRPSIKTLLNHPMYWNLRQKEMLFRGFCRDYINQLSAENDLHYLSKLFEIRHSNGLLGKEFEPVSRMFPIIESRKKRSNQGSDQSTNQSNDQSTNQSDDQSSNQSSDPSTDQNTNQGNHQNSNQSIEIDTTPQAYLIEIIRNTVVHRGENLLSFNDQEIVKLFGDSAFHCPANFIKRFPYAFFDIIVYYRRKVREYAEQKIEFLNDNYHDYFKHYAEDIMLSKTTWENASSEDKIKNIRRFITANKNFTACAKIEWCLTALSQDTSSENVNFCKDILTNNLPLMDKNYNDCIVRELDNSNYNIDNSPCKSTNKGCRYNLLEILCIEVLSKPIIIYGSTCVNEMCTHRNDMTLFDINELQLNNDNPWRLSYKRNDEDKDYNLNSGNYIDLVEILREGKNLKLCNDNRNCSYDFLDLLYGRFEILNTSLTIEGYQCLDPVCQNNVRKYVFDMRSVDSTSGGYHWWLEFERDNKRRMHSFVAMDIDNFADILRLGKDVILHRSSKKFNGKDSMATIQEDNLNCQKDAWTVIDIY